MGVLWVSVYYDIKIFHCLSVIVYHLVCLRSLMHKANVRRYLFHAATKRENRLLELLHAAICKSKMVEDIGLISEERFILECLLQCLNAFLVLLVCVEGESKLVQNLGIVMTLVQSSV